MEDYRLDSHKLIYHPGRVNEWLEKGDCYPINVELGISGACNHRCTFCSMDYMGYKPEYLSLSLLEPNLLQMKEMGVKSIVLAGNGEPLLNQDAPAIINKIKELGIDVAISTNGVLFTKEIAEMCMDSLTWMRFSTSAYSNERYMQIHKAKDGDITKVFENIFYAAQIKQKRNLDTTIGVQLVLIPENMDEAYQLAVKVKELGADYFSIKSFGYQPQSNSKLKEQLNVQEFYAKQEELEEKINSLNADNFKALYRRKRIDKANLPRTYKECHALPFYSFIDSSGEVWPCCIMLGNDGLCYGNIREQDFRDIWHGQDRKKALKKLKESGLTNCSKDCRLDEMNRYLQELKYPNTHVNFI